MNLQTMLTKKVGPLPVAVYLLVAVVGGVILWKRHQAAAAGDSSGDQTSTGDGSGGPTAYSPDSGTFQGSNSLSVNGNTASQSSAGALLTGGFVGQPGGYQFSQPGGDVFVNVPTPKQVTNVITSSNPPKDKPPAPHTPKPKTSKDKNNKPKKKSTSSTKKTVSKKKSGSGSDANSQKGNSGGGVSINLSN